MMQFDFKFGAVFYRDPIDSHSDKNEHYDLTSEINYIKKRTDVEKVHFVGYSEGSTLFLMLYMDNPHFIESSINEVPLSLTLAIVTIPSDKPHS